MAAKKRVLRNVLIITGALVLLLAVGVFVAEKVIVSKVKKAIAEEPFNVRNYGDVKVNLLSRSLTVRDLVIGDTITINKLKVSGVGYKRADSVAMVTIRLAEIDRPSGTLVMRESKKGAGGTKIEVELKKLKIDDANLNIITKEKQEYSLSGGDLELTDIVYGKGEPKFGRVVIDCHSLTHKYMHGAMEMTVEDLSFDSAGTSEIAAFKLTPLYDMKGFAERTGKDWTKAKINKIKVYGADISKMLSEKRVYADSIFVGGGDIASYKNRNVKQRPVVKPMFAEVINNIPMGFEVPHMRMESINVDYDELPESAQVPGKVKFLAVNAGIYDQRSG